MEKAAQQLGQKGKQRQDDQGHFFSSSQMKQRQVSMVELQGSVLLHSVFLGLQKTCCAVHTCYAVHTC